LLTFSYRHIALAVSVIVVAMLVAGPILFTLGTVNGLSNAWTMLPASQSRITCYYYNDGNCNVAMTVSYAIIGVSAPNAPSFYYVLNSKHLKLTLKTTATTVLVDPGSSWSVSPNPLSGSGPVARWESNQLLSGLASPTTLVFTFYLQYLQNLSFLVIAGGSGYSAPTFTANSFGTPTGHVLTTLTTGFWFDSASSWSVSNPLSGSNSGERWFASVGTSGTITGVATLAFNYQHQFFLTMQVSPSGAGSVTPSGWHNVGQAVAIMATPNLGHHFSKWTGSGVGSFNGKTNPVTVNMNSAITETVIFT
jgi:hypothetical protein